MKSLKPRALKQGDLVQIISTARKVDRDFIDHAVEVLQSWGLRVELGENLWAVDNQFAGNDQERASDLNSAIRNKDCRAIFCARGGYGTARLLESLDYKSLQDEPKWIVGYSDVTALHNAVFNTVGLVSLHATMPVNFSTNTPEALDTMKRLLFGESVEYRFDEHPFNRAGIAEGQLVGGNLSVIYSQLGSNSALDGNDQILFLEDLDEYLYHIDRMMLALKRSGMLAKLQGVVIGSMSEMNDNTVPFGKDAYEIIDSHVRDLGVPVAFGFPSGHIDDNRAWVHGKKIRLTVNDGQPCLVEFTEN